MEPGYRKLNRIAFEQMLNANEPMVSEIIQPPISSSNDRDGSRIAGVD
jgi:hypothetical protein